MYSKTSKGQVINRVSNFWSGHISQILAVSRVRVLVFKTWKDWVLVGQ